MSSPYRQACRFTQAMREQSPRTVAMFTLGLFVTSIGRGPLHYGQRPTLSELNKIGDVTTDPSTMAASLGCPEADFESYLSEFANSDLARIQQASPTVSCRYPPIFASEFNTQRVLYSLIRARRPRVVLETGVADGFSSFAILLALEANGRGSLHSIDVSNDVGELVPAHLRSRWILHINNQELKLERGFREIVAGIPDIDFYYHDSAHNYLWQSFEYALIAPKLSADGVFISDDVDWSHAFIDHCKAAGTRPAILIEGRKAVGGYVIRKGLSRPMSYSRPLTLSVRSSSPPSVCGR